MITVALCVLFKNTFLNLLFTVDCSFYLALIRRVLFIFLFLFSFFLSFKSIFVYNEIKLMQLPLGMC